MRPLHILVVDDVSRFALHLWRYLGETPGFGIGGLSINDEEGVFWEGMSRDEDHWGSPRPLITPNGDFKVWWVEASGRGVEVHLEQVLSRIDAGSGEAEIFCLADLRGKAIEGEERQYSAQDLVDKLRQWDPRFSLIGSAAQEPEATETPIAAPSLDRKILVVSSYHRRTTIDGVQTLVYPKSGDTFQFEILLRLAPKADVEQSRIPPSTGHFHILVTGAGFEYSERLVKTDSETDLGFGLPATNQVLAAALGLDARQAPEGQYPIPPGLDKYSQLKDAAENGNLDAYWDELLEAKLIEIRQGSGRRSAHKMKGYRTELEYRKSFRDAMVRHDWGHLQQALDATQGPFKIWLTTNYTRFANRAINLMTRDFAPSSRNDGPGQVLPATQRPPKAPESRSEGSVPASEANVRKMPWRIVSTSNEALLLLQELSHRPQADHVPEEERHLFKLHGDIPHVTTMALAGHDKEMFSPLSVPIDQLHLLYTVAEKQLEIGTHEKAVVWHIAGHGLADRSLVRLISRTVRFSGPDQNIFLLIDTVFKRRPARLALDPAADGNGCTADEEKQPWLRLLRSLRGSSSSWTIFLIGMSSRSYMARLGRLVTSGELEPLSASEAEVTSLREHVSKWLNCSTMGLRQSGKWSEGETKEGSTVRFELSCWIDDVDTDTAQCASPEGDAVYDEV